MSCFFTTERGLPSGNGSHQENLVVPLAEIDWVCINQKYMVQQAWQVALMGDIYRKPSRVIVWLDCCRAKKPLKSLESSSLPKSVHTYPWILVPNHFCL